jgi:hypothetical protein
MRTKFGAKKKMRGQKKKKKKRGKKMQTPHWGLPSSAASISLIFSCFHIELKATHPGGVKTCNKPNAGGCTHWYLELLFFLFFSFFLGNWEMERKKRKKKMAGKMMFCFCFVFFQFLKIFYFWVFD